MFKENLKGILENIPLILSDTTEVKDVSLLRVLIFLGFWVIVLSVIGVAIFSPEKLQQLQSYWQTGLASWSGLAGANVAKKWAPIPGQQNMNNQQPPK